MRDPEAAAELAAQLTTQWAAQASCTMAGVEEARQYDPMQLYALMGRGDCYPWMTFEYIQQMHYPRFFGYLRERNLQAEREAAAATPPDTAAVPSATGQPPDEDTLQRFFSANP